ncbi:MAG TPA: DUF1272 domain-containing protein [Solirubrobacteraceae bacterium]|jgi:hypothetical protein
MLALRPNCELCDVDLPPDSADARICTYECTFCVECVENVLRNVCPNCGGNLVARPIRPRRAWRPGAGLEHDPADTERRSVRYTLEEVSRLSEELRDVPPEQR